MPVWAKALRDSLILVRLPPEAIVGITLRGDASRRSATTMVIEPNAVSGDVGYGLRAIRRHGAGGYVRE
jgi:hypothetical protein